MILFFSNIQLIVSGSFLIIAINNKKIKILQCSMRETNNCLRIKTNLFLKFCGRYICKGPMRGDCGHGITDFNETFFG